MMESIIPLISNVGFPIVIALYVLIRLERTVQDNTRVIKEVVHMCKSERRYIENAR
jgi:hypothetical protein